MDLEEFEAHLTKIKPGENEVLLWELGSENAISDADFMEVRRLLAEFQGKYEKETGKKIFQLILPIGYINSVKRVIIGADVLKEIKQTRRFSIRKRLYKRK
jgi:hypothetical protein